MNITAIAIAAQARIPVLLWGPPGIGKTAKVNALAGNIGWHVETVIASLREPADFAGLPVVGLDGVRLAPPAWARRIVASGAESLVFFDELSTAAPATQAAVLRVIHERVVGEERLPDCAIVAAANPPECAAGGWDLSPPLANRFAHFEMGADAESWSAWAIGTDESVNAPRLPATWRDGIAAARARIAGFIRARPALLSKLPASEAERGRAWPSPRSWDMAATLAAACASVRADTDTHLALISAVVGNGAALELMAWERTADLPDSETLLADPDAFHLPSRGDVAFAVLGGVVAAASSRLTAERWRAAWRIMGAAARAGAPDIAASAARALMQAGRGRLTIAEVAGDAAAFAPLFSAAQAR